MIGDPRFINWSSSASAPSIPAPVLPSSVALVKPPDASLILVLEDEDPDMDETAEELHEGASGL
jgi:hypothetical protein